ncbi:MAG TPA: hypothetical protein VFR23_24980 [Jiangellaceae bacterium]|nr:hypothetical protein [Jiangellaceae bacterium]
MYEHSSVDDRTRRVSPWAVGGLVFASTIMIMVGIFQAFQGLAALLNDEFFVTVNDYTYELDLTTWGWIHLIGGILVLIAGIALYSASAVAGVVAIVLAGLSAVTNFFFVPYYPLWSLLIIALAVYVIWAIVKSGVFEST